VGQLIVLGFDSAAEAQDVRKELVALQQDHLIALEDAVVVECNSEGKVELHQALNLTTAGAVSGGFWGSLVGLIFLNPLLGAVVGAGVGAASGALTDLGINDGFLREVGDTLRPNTAALCLMVKEATVDRVIEKLRSHAPHAHLLQTNLSHTDEAHLQEMLDQATKKLG